MAAVGPGTYTLLSNRNYQPGSYPFPAVELTSDVVAALMELNRATWTNWDATIELVVEYSLDGAAWRTLGGLKTQCGPATAPDGSAANIVSSSFDVPDVGVVGRQVRGTMILTDKTKRTDLTITLF